MARPVKTLHTEISWSTRGRARDKIIVRGHDLMDDIMGKVNLGDMAFLEIMGRLPNSRESATFNAIAVTLVEHGLMPASIATRMTYLGAPESVQGAVAAGLLGLGSRYVGSMEDIARELQQAPDGDPTTVARAIVERLRAAKRPIPGIGHNFHHPDPRAGRLFTIARENGYDGKYCALVQAISAEGSRILSMDLPVNATGAIGAVASEMGIPWQVVRGIGIMARAIGLVAHILEERTTPIAEEIFFRAEEEATAWAKEGDAG